MVEVPLPGTRTTILLPPLPVPLPELPLVRQAPVLRARSQRAKPKGASAAVKTFSFPLTLTAMVVVFLLVQTLVDRRDPKLAAAPMSDELYM